MPTSKAQKKAPTKVSAAKNPQIFTRTKQIRLAIGFLFLILGVFTTFSIISYVFTWKQDQDLIFNSKGLLQFLQANKKPVANWGGSLGAAWSHLLVYKSFGIASFGIGVWLVTIGADIIYGKKKFGVFRYLRWLSIMLLLLAPILTFLFPYASFPFGGAIGKALIAAANLYVGQMGTGLVLAAIAIFFLFVIFALDVQPFIRRARKTARVVSGGIQNMKENISHLGTNAAASKMDEDGSNTQAEEENSLANGLAKNTQPISPLELEIKEEETGKKYDLVASDSQDVAAPIVSDTEEAIKDPLAEEYDAWLAKAIDVDGNKETHSKENSTTGKTLKSADHGDPDFEVKTAEEEPSEVKQLHGKHITLQDKEAYDPEHDLPDYKFPTLDLLSESTEDVISLNKEELEKNKNQIISTLKSFGIEISKISAIVGPTVTLYEIIPAEGVRISKIRNLEDDIALSLAALGIRIIAPIPGRGTIGIEVPNANKQVVMMSTLLASDRFINSKMNLPIALGKKIDGENYIVDLANMPHLLVAGATGQGKSVGINAILISLLYKKHPSQLKFVLVDPKIVELSIYRKIEKHFLAKLPEEAEAIITDTKKVINTLNSLCIEMDNRYELLKDGGTRNIKEYNEKFVKRRLNPLNGHKFLPFIVLVIDEFADLIMTAGKEIEMPIARLAQKARAVGMHIIIATQRPSVNVITGVIKANFPARIAFKVSSKIDSRTILDTGGAEQLIGRGDMLISHNSELLRLQCAFVDTPEVDDVVNFIGDQRGYPSAFELPEYDTDEAEEKIVDLANKDKLFEDCARLVVQTQNGSTSNLQRRFNLGYNRAGRIMDQLEAANIVGAASGSKPREVLFSSEQELVQFLETIL